MANDDPEYRSVKLTKRAYDAVVSARGALHKHGTSTLPADLRPTDAEGNDSFTLSAVVELGANMVHASMKRKA